MQLNMERTGKGFEGKSKGFEGKGKFHRNEGDFHGGLVHQQKPPGLEQTLHGDERGRWKRRC